MIRIDLGKDDAEKSAASANKKFGIEIPPAVLAQYNKIRNDLGFIVTSSVSIAVACLFPLFASQYKAVITRQHEDAIKTLNEKLQVLGNEVAKFTPFQRELQSYEEQKKIVTERLAVVRELLEKRGTPVNILDSIGQSLPSRTWINSLDLNVGATGGGSVTMSGVSYSNEEISDFIDKLGESLYLSDVSLDDVASRLEDKVQVKTFTLAAKPRAQFKVTTPASTPVAPGAPPAEAAKK